MHICTGLCEYGRGGRSRGLPASRATGNRPILGMRDGRRGVDWIDDRVLGAGEWAGRRQYRVWTGPS